MCTFCVMQMEYVMYMLTKLLISMWQSRLLGMQRLIILQPAMQWLLQFKSHGMPHYSFAIDDVYIY